MGDPLSRALSRAHRKKFKLEIDIGNAAMSQPADVAKALRKVAESLQLSDNGFATGVIPDDNGNSVGHWGVK